MSFNLIKGQDKTIEFLKDYIRNNRLASSYLFTGPEGIGKNLVARTFAKALNCENNNLDPCNECASCLKMDKLSHPDLHLIGVSSAIEEDQSEAIKIEDIRQLQREINLKPYEAKTKIFIIDNAHQLTREAANALLKVLEEPPSRSVIILVTAKPALLFKTIISRCQILKFSPLPRIELKQILKKEYNFDENQAHFFAFFCEGRLGLALRLKDTDIFREKNRVIDDFLLGANSNWDTSLAQGREIIRKYLNILALWFRDIYLIKIGMPQSEIINLDRKNELLDSAKNYSFMGLDKIFKGISDSLLYLEQNVNTKLLLSNFRLALKG